MKRILLTMTVLLAATSTMTSMVHSKPASTVKVAANIPLTGPISAWSGQYPTGFKMGIEDSAKKLNLASNSFQIDFQDNAGKPSTAVSAFQKQKLSGFDVYVSGTSEASIALAPQVEATGVPHFLVAFDPFLAREGKNRLRVLPNSKIEAPLFVDYAKKVNAKRVFIINLNSAYANSEFGSIVEPELKNAGIQFTHERFEFPEHEFRTITQKAKAYHPDLIYVCGYSTHLRPLLRDLRAAGLAKDGTIMAVMDFVDFLYDGTPKEELQGIVFACPLFEVKNAVKGAEQWRQNYKTKNGKLPSYVAAYAYDTAGILATAYKRFGNVGMQSLRKSLPYDGVTGKINVDNDGDIIATITIAKLAPDGTVKQIK